MPSGKNPLNIPSDDLSDSRNQVDSGGMLGMALLHFLGGSLFIGWAISGASAFVGIMVALAVLVVLGNFSLKSTFVERQKQQRRTTEDALPEHLVTTEDTMPIETPKHDMESSTVEDEKDKLARVTAEVIAQEDQLATELTTENAANDWRPGVNQWRDIG